MTMADTSPRRRSGFRREFGVVDVFVFNVIGYSFGVALNTNPAFIGGFAPRASLLLVLTFGALIAAANGTVYGLFAAAMPFNGGDYNFIRRSLSPGLGFAASWGFTATQIYGLGMVVSWCFNQALGPALTTMGVIAGDKRFEVAGQQMLRPGFVLAAGSVFLVCLVFLSLTGQRFIGRLLKGLFFVALATTMVTCAVFLLSSHAMFVERFDTFAASIKGGMTYKALVDLGRGHGIVVGAPTSVVESLRAAPFGFLVFLGFTYSVYLGSEVRKPERSQIVGILGALLFGYVVFMITMGQYISVVGQDFNAAIGIPDVAGAGGLPGGTAMSFFAGLLTASRPLNAFMQFGTVLWFLLLPFVMLQVCTRNVHAWARDGLLPLYFAEVSSTDAFPLPAAVLVGVLAEVVLVANYFFGITLIGAIGVVCVSFAIAGIAAVVYPKARPSDYQLAPSIVRRRLFGVSVLQGAGAFSTICFLLLLYAAIRFPQVSGTDDIRAVAILVVVYGVGTVYYLLRKRWLLKESGGGGNATELLAELPLD